MHQYWKDYGKVVIDNQHLACQVRSSLKTVILSEVETKGLKRQLRKKSDDLVETEEEAVDEVEDIVNGSMEAALTKKTIETEDWDCRDWLESDSDTKKIPKQLMRSPVEEVIFSWRGVYKCWLKQESEEANKEIYNTTLNSTNGFKNLIEASNRIVSKTSQQKQKSYENVLFDVINKISQNIINIIQYNQKDLCKDLSKAFTYKIR